MASEDRLGKEKIVKLVIQIALPSMLAQFVSVLYSIIDRIFVGNIPEVGKIALAGVGVCAPILTLVSAFAALVGIGGGPLLGIALGENNLEKAKKILANSFLMLSIIAIVVSLTFFLCRKPMLLAFGASEASYNYADTYFTICILGSIFALLSTGMYQFVIAQGYAKTGMFSIILGAVMNIGLDPLFIYVFKMGVAGAAFATIFSQFVSASFIICFLFFKAGIRLSFKGYSLKTMLNILTLGFSPFIIIALDNVMLIAVNSTLKAYGNEQGDFLITVNTIVQSFMLVITMPLGGISGGTQCILAYNFGAGKVDRVKAAQKWIMLLCVTYNTIMMILAWTASSYFASLFTNDEQVIQASVKALKICTIAIIPLGLQYEIVDGFTGMGQFKVSLTLSLWRKIVYFLAVFIIPTFLPAHLVFIAEPFSDIMAILLSLPLYFIMTKKILTKRLQTLKLAGNIQ